MAVDSRNDSSSNSLPYIQVTCEVSIRTIQGAKTFCNLNEADVWVVLETDIGRLNGASILSLFSLNLIQPIRVVLTGTPDNVSALLEEYKKHNLYIEDTLQILYDIPRQ